MRTGIITVTLTSSLIALSAYAQEALVQVSDASPFGALEECGNFPAGGEIALNSEVEPWVETNPTDPDNIVAFWQQDRWSDGGSRSNVLGVSLDGGASWEIVVPPILTDCSDGGPFHRASDPWLSYSPDGVLHQLSLVFSFNEEGNDIGDGLAASRSEDGGLTWSAPILVVEEDGASGSSDKNSITADPTDPDFVYATWLRFGAEVVNMFARSIDGGLTWEEPIELPVSGQGAQVVVLPDGVLLHFTTEFGAEIQVIRSEDQGETWSEPTLVAEIQPFGTVTPDLGLDIRSAAGLFDVAVDPIRGSVHAVWQDARFSEQELVDQTAYSESEDGGLTWSEPVQIAQTPDNETRATLDQSFIPSVAVTSDGTIGVTYYDFRNDIEGEDEAELADYFLIRCARGCTDPDMWAEIQLTDQSFDYALAPDAGGLFLGDYVGLSAGDGSSFDAFFQQALSADDPASGFFRRTTNETTVAATRRR